MDKALTQRMWDRLSAAGFQPAPKDHWIYSEGASTHFLPPTSQPEPDKVQLGSAHPLALMQESLLQEMRGFGLTDEEKAGSDGQELTASIPMGKRPVAKPKGNL